MLRVVHPWLLRAAESMQVLGLGVAAEGQATLLYWAPCSPHPLCLHQVALEIEQDETSARFVKGRLERTTLGQVRGWPCCHVLL